MIKIHQLKDYKRAAHVLAENFMEDPLYLYIFQDKKNKPLAMTLFFEAYLLFLAPYSDVLVDSEEMHMVAVVWFSNRMQSSRLYFFRTLLFIMRVCRMIPVVGFTGTWKLLKTIQKMSSTWIDRHVQEDYCHLDLAVVASKKRGQGYFSKYLAYVESHYKNEGSIFTLETQSTENVALYTHLGFGVVEEIPLPGSDLIQYCMIKKGADYGH